MPIIETVLIIIALCYLWIGYSVVVPLGWYAGMEFARTWWRDAIWVVLATICIGLWLPIVIIGYCARPYYK